MPVKMTYVYWDACVFLDYFNAHPERIRTLDRILEDIATDNHRKIITSVLSLTEVAYVQSEKENAAPDTEIEEKMNLLWKNDHIVELIDIHSLITIQGRNYIRQGISDEWRLTPMDAIHLASAKWAGVQDFHTYDTKLKKFQVITGLTICEPYAINPRIQ